MGDELRHLNSACGCVLPEEEICEENHTCGCFGGNWFWIIIIFFFFCCCNGSGGMCGMNSCSIDCGDLLTIIIILLILNCICGDEGGMFGGLFR